MKTVKHNKIKISFKRIVKLFVKVALMSLGLLLLALFIEHYFSTDLPATTGPFPVGRTTLYIKGKLPEDSLNREIFAWIWYPGVSRNGHRANYIPANWLNAFNDSKFFLSHFFERSLGRVRTQSFQETDVSPALKSYPVILFRGGMSTLSAEYTSLCENWASHGYFVIGLDAPYLSRVFVDSENNVIERAKENNPEINGLTMEVMNEMLPRLVAEWAGNATITLNFMDSLSRAGNPNHWCTKMDLNRVAMIGHSLGGAAALQFSIQDFRCIAAINIDGFAPPPIVNNGMQKPTLFIIGEHSQSELTDPVNRKIFDDIQLAIQRTPVKLFSRSEIPNANHYNFSDGAVTKNHLLLMLLRMVGIIKMDPVQQLNATSQATLQFLNKQLAVDMIRTN